MRIGCAGWNVPKQHMALFPAAGSHLHRYARRFNAVEINSSFYRPHRRATYERWRQSVPESFRFSVKLPRTITHEGGRAECQSELLSFMESAGGLGQKLAVLLVQLPASLEFDESVASIFF